jgi:hypothetical protein
MILQRIVALVLFTMITYDTTLSRYRDTATGRFVRTVEAARSDLLLLENTELSERLAALEMALESADWRLLTWQSQHEFSREGLRQMVELARVVALKNPIVKRSIAVQQLYVWGQDWSVKARDPNVNTVIQAFLDDPKNAVELTGHTARMDKEKEQQTDGNLFLIFFVNKLSGRVRVRSIPLEQIQQIICSPDDSKEPWYYERVWSTQTLTESGAIESKIERAYYPDWRYTPTAQRPEIAGIPVMWDTPILHVKTGGYSHMKFGLSEIYAQLDWSQAYKNFLEDWSAIVRAYRRFAFDLATPGGKQSIAAAKAKLNTTVGTGTGTIYDTNPPPVAGGVFIHDGNTQLNPIRTQGATVGAEDGRRLLLMVAAAAGLPETFYGDVSVGTLATANSLDRPTELQMANRQKFWADIFEAIFQFVLLWAVKAPAGPLRGAGSLVSTVDEDQREEHIEWGETKAHVDIDFPPILNEPTVEQVSAIISAATLDGKQLAGTIDIVTMTRMLLSALGEDDLDEIMEELFPAGKIPAWATPEALAQQRQAASQARQTMQQEAIQELKAKLLRMWEAE